MDGGQRDTRPGMRVCVSWCRVLVCALPAAWPGPQKVGAETAGRVWAGTVQLGGVGAPVALTARWTNDYESLLNREATKLPGTFVRASARAAGEALI